MLISKLVAGLGLFSGLFVLCAVVADLVCWGVCILAKKVRGWTRDEDGTTTVEYALILAVVVVTCVSVVMALHTSVAAPVTAATQVGETPPVWRAAQ